jgi:hypothetical protein
MNVSKGCASNPDDFVKKVLVLGKKEKFEFGLADASMTRPDECVQGLLSTYDGSVGRR